MTTAKQRATNRSNAKHSTGPRTEEGKRIVSANRMTHGLLSTRLLLAGEDPEEFHALADGLRADLQPEGVLECALVERIAVALWRQRRLVAAESASLALVASPKRIADEVSRGLGRSEFASNAVTPSDLEAPDREQLAWCRSVLHELDAGAPLTLERMASDCPFTWGQLRQDAEAASSVEEFLRDDYAGSLGGYLQELGRWCRQQLDRARDHQAVADLASEVRLKLGISWDHTQLLTRYQTALDNALYRAIRALQDTQAARIRRGAALSAEFSVEQALPEQAA